MEMLLLVAFLLFSVAIFLAFGVTTNDVTALFEKKKEDTFKSQMKDKENVLVKFVNDTKDMLSATGQTGKFNFVLILTVVLVVVGAFVAGMLGNLYLVPVFAIACGILPFIYIRFQFISYNKLVIEELVTAMSSVTTSYERTENILMAFKENTEDTREPIRSIFESFVHEMENVNPNYETAIEHMKGRIDNSVWVEWCEALKRCSRNRGIKYVLSPIVTKLSKINVVTGELQNILMDCIKDFWMLIVAALALLYVGVFVLPSGLMIDIPENLSNILIALNFAVALIVSIKATLITREIKFDL